ncbi:MAG: 4-hydroxythreonine-4-phosphate dehydrogenase PdxA [Ignavibacteriae bacterium]|nr:MAG: 4-hydroxythreonine-4-phosphate dehydrogenase PdxA [Ignavibacteriota bacterium]
MKTRILITIGDMNGIGPEIILKALGTPGITDTYDITLIAPTTVIEYYYRLLGLEPMQGKFNIISICEGKANVEPGVESKEAGYIAGFAIKMAVNLCVEERYDAIVTAPISKNALNLGGFKYAGHTEMLTELDNPISSAMVMISDKLKIGFATTHPPLDKVAGLITKKLMEEKIRTCFYSMKNDFGIEEPKIGVLSLNPHAGEHGQIGNEEIKVITPVLEKLKETFKTSSLDGPFSSDAYFGNKTYERYDMTFALYHDQGFIPFKMIAGLKGVNYTAGLSFVRTSPDHGTAFDIAGKNIADPASIIEAIKAADIITKNRKEI